MDANGLRFWQLADAAAWPDLRHVVFGGACTALRLASERSLQPALAAADGFTVAQAALENVPRAIDALGCVASWDAASSSVLVHSVLPDDAVLTTLPVAPTDLCVSADGGRR